jgi:DNA-binding ferritin-like protein
MKACDFVGILFLARDVTHSVHLNTRSYSKHKALQKFYENIIELADNFAEAYQGRHGLMGPISLQSAKKTTNVLEFLESQLEEIEADRYKVCDETDTAIQNLIDEVVALYLSTIYRLRFLA